ncbi:hypothetical protein LIN78_06655 [Leeia sp. TBRC 13508]|uniref:Uncharacterized protein n=1 Tax=Leeia speluncae TaxID=2884804 RepID=A0ABS8D4S6_9NEIS|nr:hypothetical protein [Leeia speluncae]MCB6183220.1 hypothetical protein [Leeia speluncae]
MKKLLAAVAVTLVAGHASAADWVNVGDDNRVDLDAVKKDGDQVTYQIRWDNPKDADEYQFTEVVVDCKTGITRLPRYFNHKKTGPQGYQATTGEDAKSAVPEDGTVVSVLNHQLCSGKPSGAAIEQILLGDN